MTRLVLRIEYDGTDFHGFAESEGVRTVAGEVRQIVERVTSGAEVALRGASRTDTGVHALDQCLRIDVEAAIGWEELARAITALTPADIEVRSAAEATAEFDPSRDAIEKRYLYRIWNARQAPVLGRQRLWRVGPPLDVEAMRSAALPLIGTHDFAAFRNRSKGEPENSVRSIRAIALHQSPPELWIQVIGDGFLYRMVRNVVGTLVEVGRGAKSAESVGVALRSLDRRLAGPSAPPHGLHLAEIRYPGEPECVMDENPLRF